MLILDVSMKKNDSGRYANSKKPTTFNLARSISRVRARTCTRYWWASVCESQRRGARIRSLVAAGPEHRRAAASASATETSTKSTNQNDQWRRGWQ
mmetsp:Transcript_24971/g.51085  ORF Transcript_24971/g.51085 Transcript_24971/m.51085 type:complete len:96 (-) Transcript_24971:54-341(-)